VRTIRGDVQRNSESVSTGNVVNTVDNRTGEIGKARRVQLTVDHNVNRNIVVDVVAIVSPTLGTNEKLSTLLASKVTILTIEH
jgi:hypothetical protein